MVAGKRTARGQGAKQGAQAEGSTASRLLTEAAALFRARGYARTTIRQLGDQLGVRGASLYHHISSKEVLLYEICIRSLSHIIDDFEQTVSRTSKDPDRIRALFTTHLDCAITERDMHATMLTEFRELSPRHRREVIKLRAEYEALWREQLEAGQQDGWIRSDIDAKYLTLTLLNMLNWTIFWYEPGGELKPGELADLFYKVYAEGTIASS